MVRTGLRIRSPVSLYSAGAKPTHAAPGRRDPRLVRLRASRSGAGLRPRSRLALRRRAVEDARPGGVGRAADLHRTLDRCRCRGGGRIHRNVGASIPLPHPLRRPAPAQVSRPRHRRRSRDHRLSAPGPQPASGGGADVAASARGGGGPLAARSGPRNPRPGRHGSAVAGRPRSRALDRCLPPARVPSRGDGRLGRGRRDRSLQRTACRARLGGDRAGIGGTQGIGGRRGRARSLLPRRR